MIFLLLPVLLAAAPTQGAEAAASDSSADSGLPLFEFKGIHSADTADMHVAKWGSLAKSIPACQMGGRFGIATIFCSFADRTVSGVNFSLSAGFVVKGSLREISGLGDIGYLETLHSAFENKYGRAKFRGFETFQDGAGRETQIPKYAWDFSDGHMILGPELSYDKKRLYTRFRFTTSSFEREISAEIELTKPRPTVDF